MPKPKSKPPKQPKQPKQPAPPAPPQAVAVEVVATRPTDADTVLMAQLDRQEGTAFAPVVYLVKVALDKLPEPAGHGWALYIGDLRVPKYWAYPSGIYFKVYDPAFIEEHRGKKIRFSGNGTDFVDTGLKLGAPAALSKRGARDAALPDQGDVLT